MAGHATIGVPRRENAGYPACVRSEISGWRDRVFIPWRGWQPRVRRFLFGRTVMASRAAPAVSYRDGSSQRPLAPPAGANYPPCVLSGISGWRDGVFIRWRVAAERRAGSNNRKTRRLLINRPCLGFVYEESRSKRTTTRQQLDVQRLYNYVDKETAETLTSGGLSTCSDPTRVRTVADKNSAVTPLNLRQTVAD